MYIHNVAEDFFDSRIDKAVLLLMKPSSTMSNKKIFNWSLSIMGYTSSSIFSFSTEVIDHVHLYAVSKLLKRNSSDTLANS